MAKTSTYSTSCAIGSAESSWSVGDTWLYMPSVIEMVECPKRSGATMADFPFERRRRAREPQAVKR